MKGNSCRSWIHQRVATIARRPSFYKAALPNHHETRQRKRTHLSAGCECNGNVEWHGVLTLFATARGYDHKFRQAQQHPPVSGMMEVAATETASLTLALKFAFPSMYWYLNKGIRSYHIRLSIRLSMIGHQGVKCSDMSSFNVHAQ